MKIFNKKILLNILFGALFLFSAYNANAAPEESDPISAISNAHSNSSEVVSTNDDKQKSLSPSQKQSQDAIGNMLLQSVSLMGIAYKWGGNTPDTGMDCSGFVRYVFSKSLGITLPRTAGEMAKVGKRISINNLQPGDLIFFNTSRGSNTHIGIYLGGNKFIQSPRTGENIQITDLSGYWIKHFNGAKRVVQENLDSDGNQNLEDYQDVHDEALPVAKRSHKGKRSGRTRHGHKSAVASNHSSTRKASKSGTSSKSSKAKIKKSKRH